MLLRGGEVDAARIPPAPWWALSRVATVRRPSVVLEPGDLLVAYTDGIVEPENAYGEMFGEERLKDLLLRSAMATERDHRRSMEAVQPSGPAPASCRTI